MSLKIIGAGFPRTGTMTLKNALETLGYTKTYHYIDLIADAKRLKYWQDLENKEDTNFDALFKGFQASVDFPGYPYYKILLKKYPDAKVILTHRDFEQWYESTQKTIWKSANKPLIERIKLFKRKLLSKNLRAIFRCIAFMRKVYLYGQFENRFDSKQYAKKVFYKHIEEVKDHVPKKQLLVYDVAQGWEPLCEFLNLPIPTEAFPHLNKKEHFHNMVKAMIKTASKNAND
ncbi:MAG: sulfotransferase family protein [Gilvibacter sp.]